MGKILPFLLAILTPTVLLKFFPWPLPYYTVVDELYGTLGLNYRNLVFDFLVIFLMASVVIGIVELLLVVLVVKSLFRETGGNQPLT